MNRHSIRYLGVVALTGLFLLGMGSANCTLYLPFVVRAPTATRTAAPTHTPSTTVTATPTATCTTTLSATPTATATATPTCTPTPTATPAYTLSGRVFFDYNGSGLQEEGEPGIQGVPVYVDSVGSALHATTGADGSYSISNVSPGAHQVYVQSPTQDPATAFRYINLFKGWVDIPAYEMNGVQVPAQHLPHAEMQPITQSVSLTMSDNREFILALMQQFLTLPYCEDERTLWWISSYVDLDPRVGAIRLFNSMDHMYWSRPDGEKERGGTGDQHPGIDFEGPKDNFITAPCNGVLNVNAPLILQVPPYKLSFGHHNGMLVQNDSYVMRGQIIGLNGTSANGQHPRIHLECILCYPWRIRA